MTLPARTVPLVNPDERTGLVSRPWYAALTALFAQVLAGAFDSLTLDKASGGGIKVDLDSPTYGWRDLLSTFHTRSAGLATPSFAAYAGTSVYAYFMSNAATQELFIEFHLTHDYVPGSDIFIHVHWSQTTVDSGGLGGIPGQVKFNFDVLYAKGHQQQAFPAAVTTVSVTQTASETVRQHMIPEVQLSTNGAIGGNDLEVDGIILCRVWRDPTDAADTLDQVPWMHFGDIHYQSTNMATKQKSFPFYT